MDKVCIFVDGENFRHSINDPIPRNGFVPIGKHAAIEFRKAGTITCNLLENNRFGREKAVDVKLASDLIALKDIYDIAVIVSGDQDYVPAVQVIKDYGKRVVTVAFERRDGRLLPGGARQLNQASDWGLPVKHSDLDSFLKILPQTAED